MSNAADVWRKKSDDELRQAAKTLHDYTEDGRKIILAELSRRGLQADISTALPQGADDGAAPVDRYLDAYRVASGVVWIGDVVKGLGFVIGAVLVVGAVTQFEGGARFGGIVFGILVALAFWVGGVFTSAHGQLLRATLDTAVHSSPFLTDRERALAMSLPPSAVPRQRTAV